MMIVECPWCGPRPEAEFVNGGQAAIARPPLTASDDTWVQYRFFRDNPRGRLAERWCHRFGCERWFNTVRDTVTHRRIGSYGILERPPVAPSAGGEHG